MKILLKYVEHFQMLNRVFSREVQVCNLFIELCITEKFLNILYEFLYQLTLNN